MQQEVEGDQKVSAKEILLAFLGHARVTYSQCLDNDEDAIGRVGQLIGCSPADSFGPKSLKIVRQAMIEQGLSRTYIAQSGWPDAANLQMGSGK